MKTPLELGRVHAENWVVATDPITKAAVFASDPIYSAGDYADVIETDDAQSRLSILDILDEVAKRMIRRKQFQDERLLSLHYRAYGDYVYRMLRDLHSPTGKLYAEDVPADIQDAASYQVNHGVVFMLQPVPSKVAAARVVQKYKDEWLERLAAVQPAKADYIPAGYGPWVIFPETIEALDDTDRTEPGFRRTSTAQVLFMEGRSARGKKYYALGYDGDELLLPWTRREAETAPAWVYWVDDADQPLHTGIFSDDELGADYIITNLLSESAVESDAVALFGCDRFAIWYEQTITVNLPALGLVLGHGRDDFANPVATVDRDTWDVDVIEQSVRHCVYKLTKPYSYSITMRVDDDGQVEVESVDGLDNVASDDVVAGGALIRAFNYASANNPMVAARTNIFRAVQDTLGSAQKHIASLRRRGMEKYPRAMEKLVERLRLTMAFVRNLKADEWMKREIDAAGADPLATPAKAKKPRK